MNQDEYENHLTEDSGYCDCPALSELFALRRKHTAYAESAKRHMSEFWTEDDDLEGMSEDSDDYFKEGSVRMGASLRVIRVYLDKLQELRKTDCVILRVHKMDGEGKWQTQDVKYRDRLQLDVDEDKAVFSFNCSSCGQLIQVTDLEDALT